MICLESKRKSYFDCFEDCFTSIIDLYHKDYMYVFAQAWRVNPHEMLQKDIMAGVSLFLNSCKIVDTYCGLKSDIRNFYKYEYLESYIKECIKSGKPVIVSVDLYDLPWSEDYQKIHSFHFVILHDYLEHHKFSAFDVTKQLPCVPLDLRNAFGGKTCTVVVSNEESREEVSIEDVVSHAKQLLQNDIEQKGGYDVFIEFIKYCIMGNHEVFQYAIEEVEAEPLTLNLLRFGRGRIAYSEFLRHVQDKCGISCFESIITDLGNIGAKWLTLRNKIMKFRIKGTFYEKATELGQQFIQLIDQEKKLYERFMVIDMTQKVAKVEDLVLSELTPHRIDIHSYFNSNAFNSSRWDNPSGFDRNGYYFELEQEEIYDKEANCDLNFYIHQKLDNISCNGQRVDVMVPNVKAIMIVGSCENGDYSDELSISYEHGEEKATLIYPDWWEYNRFHEKVVMKLTCSRLFQQKTHTMGEVYIFSQTIPLEKGDGDLLQFIKLPECSNIHIFGLIVYN